MILAVIQGKARPEQGHMLARDGVLPHEGIVGVGFLWVSCGLPPLALPNPQRLFRSEG